MKCHSSCSAVIEDDIKVKVLGPEYVSSVSPSLIGEADYEEVDVGTRRPSSSGPPWDREHPEDVWRPPTIEGKILKGGLLSSIFE